MLSSLEIRFGVHFLKPFKSRLRSAVPVRAQWCYIFNWIIRCPTNSQLRFANEDWIFKTNKFPTFRSNGVDSKQLKIRNKAEIIIFLVIEMRLPEYMIKGYEKWKIEMREAEKVLARYKITSLNRIPRIPQSGYTYIQSLQLRYQNLQGFHPPKRSHS